MSAVAHFFPKMMELSAQSAFRAVQANRDVRRQSPDDHGNLGVSQLLPDGEPDELSVTLTKTGEGFHGDRSVRTDIVL